MDEKARGPGALWGGKRQPGSADGVELPAAGDADDFMPGKAQLGRDGAADRADAIDDNAHVILVLIGVGTSVDSD